MTNERYVPSVSNTNSTVCNRRSSAFIELETSLRDARDDDKALSDWCISSLTDYILGSQRPASVQPESGSDRRTARSEEIARTFSLLDARCIDRSHQERCGSRVRIKTIRNKNNMLFSICTFVLGTMSILRVVIATRLLCSLDSVRGGILSAVPSVHRAQSASRRKHIRMSE
jgi:hypothetical protein